jgi:hypothetical protein
MTPFPYSWLLEEEVRTDKSLMEWLQDVAQKFIGLTTHILDVEAEAGDEGVSIFL